MLKNLKKSIKNHPVFWKYYRNRNAISSFNFTQMDSLRMKVLSSLKSNGIAFSSFTDFFPDMNFDDFSSEIYNELANYEVKGGQLENDIKSYFHFVLGLNPKFDANSTWNKIASHSNLQQFSDAYFGMKGTQMRYYNIWKHEASAAKPKGSQLWHRDREDLKILKVFVCIEDVDEFNGPFTYAPGTHLEGDVKREPKSFKEPDGTNRTTDEMMEAVVPKEKWIRALGKKGTIVFADTHGYHKGGEVLKNYRLLFTCMYVSPSCGRVYFS